MNSKQDPFETYRRQKSRRQKRIKNVRTTALVNGFTLMIASAVFITITIEKTAENDISKIAAGVFLSAIFFAVGIYIFARSR